MKKCMIICFETFVIVKSSELVRNGEKLHLLQIYKKDKKCSLK